jgi:hypothetical protein
MRWLFVAVPPGTGSIVNSHVVIGTCEKKAHLSHFMADINQQLAGVRVVDDLSHAEAD